MTNENTASNPKFRKEGEGYDLNMLDCTYTPVYYGFNCRPRQVKYHKVERSVEDVLKGSVSRPNALTFRVKIQVNLEKAQAKQEDYKKQLAKIEKDMEGLSYSAKQHLRKAYHALDTRAYNHSYKVDAYIACIQQLTDYLAE